MDAASRPLDPIASSSAGNHSASSFGQVALRVCFGADALEPAAREGPALEPTAFDCLDFFLGNVSDHDGLELLHDFLAGGGSSLSLSLVLHGLSWTGGRGSL